MHENTSAPAAPRPGASLLGAVIAVLGALAMGAALRSLGALARTSTGSEVLIAWVLLGLAALGVLLCLHLALVWGLAATIMLAGPASRTGAALLGPLRVLAPRLARRVVGGAAVATATTALTLAPSLATQYTPLGDPSGGASTVEGTSQVLAADASPLEPDPEAAASRGDDASEPEEPGTDAEVPLPPLGWGDAAPEAAPEHAPSAGAGSRSAADTAPPAGSPAPEGTGIPRTIVVQPGDSLWSLTDDLLGPGSSDPADVAAAWPLLHQDNLEVIGEDPDHLLPGQELTVPATMTTQDTP